MKHDGSGKLATGSRADILLQDRPSSLCEVIKGKQHWEGILDTLTWACNWREILKEKLPFGLEVKGNVKLQGWKLTLRDNSVFAWKILDLWLVLAMFSAEPLLVENDLFTGIWFVL